MEYQRQDAMEELKQHAGCLFAAALDRADGKIKAKELMDIAKKTAKTSNNLLDKMISLDELSDTWGARFESLFFEFRRLDATGKVCLDL